MWRFMWTSSKGPPEESMSSSSHQSGVLSHSDSLKVRHAG
jgi:hypothetical protein